MRYGKRLVGKEIILVSRFVPKSGTSLGRPRFAFIVSTKVDKRATRRNRMKRLLSESVAHLIPRIIGSSDYIFIAKKDVSETTQAEIEAMIAQLLNI
jgi:ribonuclease P protein component